MEKKIHENTYTYTYTHTHSVSSALTCKQKHPGSPTCLRGQMFLLVVGGVYSSSWKFILVFPLTRAFSLKNSLRALLSQSDQPNCQHGGLGVGRGWPFLANPSGRKCSPLLNTMMDSGGQGGAWTGCTEQMCEGRKYSTVVNHRLCCVAWGK